MIITVTSGIGPQECQLVAGKVAGMIAGDVEELGGSGSCAPNKD